MGALQERPRAQEVREDPDVESGDEVGGFRGASGTRLQLQQAEHGALGGVSPADLQRLIGAEDSKTRPFLKAEKGVASPVGGPSKADLGRIRELVPDGWELHVKDEEVVMKRSASP